eukprot:740260-Prymnesium_polylepis.1
MEVEAQVAHFLRFSPARGRARSAARGARARTRAHPAGSRPLLKWSSPRSAMSGKICHFFQTRAGEGLAACG